jgi:hypothetical protein
MRRRTPGPVEPGKPPFTRASIVGEVETETETVS